jgi:peptide/nickel transport system substrate-binding protein
MCGLLILLTLLACARGGLPESVDLVVALDTTPQTLDPRFATDAASVHTLQLITDGLYRIDPEGRPVPNLAAEGRYEAPDRFRVELRSGVRFHDGRRLTARDVVATYRSVRSPETASPLQQELASVREVRADGDQVVLFELEGPFAPLLYKLAGVAILPESQVRSPEPIEAPIGTGPYRLREFSRGEYVMLDAYPGYHHGRPRSEHVLLRVVPTAATRALELLKGSVHLVVNGLPPYLVGALERKPGLRVVYGPGSSTTYMGLNLEHPAIKDARVREAIAYALDRQAIVDTLLAGRGNLAAALLPPGHWARPTLDAGRTHDPVRARRLLDEAGYPEAEDGAPRLVLSYKTSTNRLRRQIGEVLAAQLADVGIELEVRSLEWGTFYSDVKAGNFHTYTLKWVGLFDPDIFFFVFHSDSVPPDGANRGRYRNGSIDRRIEASRTELDPARRRALYGEIERELGRDLPYVFLWHEDDIAVMSSRLEGFVLEPGGGLRGLTRVHLREEGS